MNSPKCTEIHIKYKQSHVSVTPSLTLGGNFPSFVMVTNDSRMIYIEKYRFLALSLTSIFLLFNVGLPIVLASCPMMTSGNAISTCTTCCSAARSTGPSLISHSDRSCCKTVIAADRNRNEFLQSNEHPVQPVAHSFFLMTDEVSTLTRHSSFASLCLASLIITPEENIPLFTSSLLL